MGGASLRLPAACRLIAVSAACLPSVNGLVVRCLKMHRHVKPAIAICFQFIIPPASTKLKGGYTGFTLSVWRRQERRSKYVVQLASWQLRSNSPKMSVCPSVDRIVSALYLQQYSSDPFHICTSYQATSEGVWRVMFVSKFKNLKFWRIL